MKDLDRILQLAEQGQGLSDADSRELIRVTDLEVLLPLATKVRDLAHPTAISYSRKVFVPLTHLCRDVCHYCTFAQVPRKLEVAYMSPEQVLEIARQGADAGCKEILFTLGDKPEARYKAAREGLKALGYGTTLEYLRAMAELVLTETGLFPHLNPGLMTREEMAALRKVSISMGIMLESASDRLTEKGMPHYGSPDKVPARRLETIRLAGELGVPFTSGILIGIGETRAERIDSLLALRHASQDHGQIQELIIQNFRAKPGTKMVDAPEPDLDELLWTIAVARLLFGSEMNIQAPPNLSPGVFHRIIASGINDWGGVSPVTPDFVNPEAPWPHLEELAKETAREGKVLVERLAVYPSHLKSLDRWIDSELQPLVRSELDGEGFVRREDWSAGAIVKAPQTELNRVGQVPMRAPSADLAQILDRASAGQRLAESEIVRLFKARGDELSHIYQAADKVRRDLVGDVVTYCVNRNINYTNVCYFKCQFCAFSKGKMSENLRGRPYDLAPDEIMRRTREAFDRGATEVCLQGGIHPEYTGQTYLDICHTIKQVVPQMHIHAFSPLEVWQGAKTLGKSLTEFLGELKEAGLGTLPGTAAEILDDEVRATLCPDKINTEQWLEVMRAAHEVGFNTTATIMYGHIERYEHVARHLLRIRDLQTETGGFTEFVILPFIHMEAPMYLKGGARKGPTFREALLIHAISRLVLNPVIKNIQASWTKLGHEGARACLNAGVNDLGGTLMNETITRAAGASHGQETSPEAMEALILSAGRIPQQRTTTYQPVDEAQREKSLAAPALVEPSYTAARRYDRKTPKNQLVRNERFNEERLTSSEII
ncbi:MAG: 5-amino-6-(D-ribitylamino)uracil--L-tyrosine 4-hydroxyphenyl transferase CofH [Pseudomonadales bacterium]